LDVFGKESKMITINESLSDINNKINQSIAKYLNEKLRRNSSKIVEDIKEEIPNLIKQQPEIKSLLNESRNTLFSIFGLPYGTSNSTVDAIVDSISNSILYNIEYIDKNLNGGLTIHFQPKNLQNLLNLPAGHVIDGDTDLHWLKWLLTLGDTIIVANYQYTAQSGLGRSKNGIMTTGNSFRVPPQYSGTLNDNFITRMFATEKVRYIIKSNIEKGLFL
jgi:hypothetical protein